jgi:hypothetical protein
MPTIPSGYISLEKAKAKLGPLLIGKGWIGELTARERWLVDKHNKNPRHIVYVSSTGGIPWLPSNGSELEVALYRDSTMLSQHEQAEEWLDDRELLFEIAGDDEVVEFVPDQLFEDALRVAGLSRAGNGAETECAEWLLSIGGTELKKWGKAHWKGEAQNQKELSRLSGRGFDRAWANVATTHPEISGAGAKSKPR